MRVAVDIHLSAKERRTLRRWSLGQLTAVRQAQRARMILLAANGFSNADIAEELGVKPHTVGRWRNRFYHFRLEGLEKDLPRGGRPVSNSDVVSEVIRKTTQETPEHATHWSTRSPLALHTRETMDWVTPSAVARLRVLQCVACSGVDQVPEARRCETEDVAQATS